MNEKQPAEKSEVIAAILSFLLPGAGQIYNGDVGKGAILIGVVIVNIFLIIITFGLWAIIAIPVNLILMVYAVYDAYTTTRKNNETV